MYTSYLLVERHRIRGPTSGALFQITFFISSSIRTCVYVCMHVYMHACVCVCFYVCEFKVIIFLYPSICTCMRMYVCMHGMYEGMQVAELRCKSQFYIPIHIHTNLSSPVAANHVLVCYMFVYKYIHTYIHTYIYIHAYIYIHTYTHTYPYQSLQIADILYCCYFRLL